MLSYKALDFHVMMKIYKLKIDDLEPIFLRWLKFLSFERTSGPLSTRLLLCKAFLYAFVPYDEQYAFFALPCRHNEDIEIVAPCHTPTFDDS